MKVFLGGTCAESTWRDILIPMLLIEYFNPVVDDWTSEAQAEEIVQRQECDFVLYVITPRMKGVYSIAEVIDDSNKRPEKVFFAIVREGDGERFDDAQWRSLQAVTRMVTENGGLCWTLESYEGLEHVAFVLNEIGLSPDSPTGVGAGLQNL